MIKMMELKEEMQERKDNQIEAELIAMWELRLKCRKDKKSLQGN